jgi:hypothetical protein
MSRGSRNPVFPLQRTGGWAGNGKETIPSPSLDLDLEVSLSGGEDLDFLRSLDLNGEAGARDERWWVDYLFRNPNPLGPGSHSLL